MAHPFSGGDVQRVHLRDIGRVGESRALVEPTYKRVMTPQQVRKLQYKNQLQQFALNTPLGLKSALVRGDAECPVIGDKPMKAYLSPNPDWDAKLKQQWSITRKDYRGRNVNLFCYPDGEFDGVDFTPDADNQPVDLSMYTYASPGDVSESLKTLVELLLPQNSITNVERQRVRITNDIVKLQKSAEINKYFEKGVIELAKILATCERYAGISTARKAKLVKAKAKELLKPVHSAAIATIALDSQGDKAKYCRDHNSTHKTKKIHNIEVDACVPEAIYASIDNDEDFVTFFEKNKIKKALSKYAEGIAAKSELLEDPNWEDSFFKLSKHQKV